MNRENAGSIGLGADPKFLIPALRKYSYLDL
jgi:hypothetical protein